MTATLTGADRIDAILALIDEALGDGPDTDDDTDAEEGEN